MLKYFEKKISVAVRKNASGQWIYLPVGRLCPGFILPSPQEIRRVKWFYAIWVPLNYFAFFWIVFNLKIFLEHDVLVWPFIFFTLDYLVLFLGAKLVTPGLQRDEEGLKLKFLSSKYRGRNLFIGIILVSIGVACFAAWMKLPEFPNPWDSSFLQNNLLWITRLLSFLQFVFIFFGLVLTL